MSFGGHLRALREAAGLSRAALARRAGVPASTLGNWEGDRGMPGLPALVRLAAALGVPVERFAEGVEDPAERDADPGPTPTKKGRAGRLSEAQEKPRERKTRRPRGG
jgi:transcriptional regulator with XRE-family HTH domain